MCALIRSLVDAYYALAYIAAEPISDDERGFRRSVWALHAESRRHHLLELIGSKAPDVAKIQMNIDRLQAEVKSHPFFASIPPKIAPEVARGERSYHLSHLELNARLAIDHDYYRTAYVFLSSYVHTYPFSLSQLALFRAGSGESLHLMALAIQFCVGYFALSIRAFGNVVSSDVPPMSNQVAKIVDEWVRVISNGVQDVGAEDRVVP